MVQERLALRPSRVRASGQRSNGCDTLHNSGIASSCTGLPAGAFYYRAPVARGGIMLSLHVEISEESADSERLAVLSAYMRAELLELDVENVTPLEAGELPAGTRAAAVTVAGGLLVTVGQAADSLQSVLLVIKEWLRRGGRADRKVRLELDGDVLELSAASAAEQERLIGLFVSRHDSGPGS